LLILKALSLGAMHGWGVADRIERLSDGICAVPQGAVYPALQRVLRQGWATAEWRTTDSHRRARYYRLTASGRRQLERETAWWQGMVGGIDRVLRAKPQEA
jgi:transcriptional regulator